MGRKPLVGTQEKARSPRIVVRLPQDLHDRLREHCANTGCTPSQIVRDALVSYLDLML